ncbi:antigen peptide transporter 2 [Eucyclogobius newberryi]|uniref:antigen peptide transporter 2 n=1 Tax=Eucyclogobius newberryi TaxID=166745 RepID=UPI003B5CA901
MKELTTCVLSVLLLDLTLGWTYWIALLLLKSPISGGLGGLWALGAVNYMCLYYLSSALTGGKPEPVLRRLVFLLCLLGPVLETGQMLMSKADRAYMGPPPDLTRVPLSTVATLLACVIWEKGLYDEKSAKRKPQIQGARERFGRLLQFFKPDVLCLAFSALIVGAVCDTVIPLYQGNVIDMLKASMVETNLRYAIATLACVSLGSAMFSGVRGGLFMFSLARLNRRLKHILFHTLLQQEIHFFEENNAGELSSRLHSDVDRMGRTVALNANVLVRSTFKTCLMLVLMVQLSWELTLLTVLEMPLLGLVQNRYTTKSTELKEQIQSHHAEISALVLQSVSGIETVRSFNAEKVEIKRYQAALDKLCGVKRQRGIYSSIYCLIRRMVSLMIKIFFFVLARRLILSNQLSIGCLVSFLLYQKPMSNNLREIMNGYGETKSTVGVISKVFSYLDRNPKCQTAGDLAPEKLEGRIVFENVSFTYPSKSSEKTAPTALRSVSMELRAGQMTALVGPSGSGKTTCVSLLKRLYEPQEGQILLDGQPLHKYELKYLHNKMAVVSQNPVLFCGSIKYNIEYGLKESNIDQVREAAKRINAESFVSELDRGYDTDVGEAGGKLSEGLKQSIAILRALVRDPQVIILDEATSKLDVLAQHAVLGEVLSAGRTVLVVAHQLKTVEKADHIIFLENGEIIEEGTHQDLMDKRGRYYSLKEDLFKT